MGTRRRNKIQVSAQAIAPSGVVPTTGEPGNVQLFILLKKNMQQCEWLGGMVMCHGKAHTDEEANNKILKAPTCHLLIIIANT